MNWAILQHSLLLAYAVAKFSLLLGSLCAIWSQTLSARGNAIVTGLAAMALALPPFLSANTWMHFFGLAGVWRPWFNFDLYSWAGATLLMTLLLWPVSFFLVRGSLARLETERLEADPLLHGWRLVRWILFPHLRSTFAVASLLTFVLALNHFSIPALLQTKVYSADVWVEFNTTFDYLAALKLGWPLILAPLIALAFLRDRLEIWPARKPMNGPAFAAALGAPWTIPIAIISCALLAVTIAFPLGHLISSANSWKQMLPAAQAGHSAFAATLITSLGGATIAIIAALLISRRAAAPSHRRGRRKESFPAQTDSPEDSSRRPLRRKPRFSIELPSLSLLAWLPFMIPGVIMGIALIRLLNRPALAWLYPSLGLVVAALALRYLALPLQAVMQARRSLPHDLLLAARADGATPRATFWKLELPLLAGPIFFAWYLAYLFCLWDAETLVMIVPPGGETFSLRVFNMLHYGHTDQVNALCLWLILLAVAPLLIRAGLRKFQSLKHTPAFLLALLAALFLTGCSPIPEGAVDVKSQLFTHVEVLGHRGNGVGEFNKPRSVSVDREDNLYVVDITGRVQKFSPEGKYLLSWQMPQTDKGKPKGMALDLDGNVIVIEPHYNRVNYYRPDGSLVYQWGTEGTNAGQLVFPRCVAVNSTGELYIGEYGLVERVQRFSIRGTNLLTLVGSAGEGESQFRRAEGVGVDAQDRLFVADSCNHRIQVFSRDGKFLRQHGSAGTAAGQMSYPYDVRVDRAGYEFVCEFGNSRIQIFDRDSRPVEILGGIGGEPGKFNNPWAICIDSKGNLYVADSSNHRVQKFVRKSALASGKTGTPPDVQQLSKGGGA